ncbi:MAG: hypothetical protein HWN67_08545 [Candidatus Helarchaeota archaeon]|nr:hypothetical protein [Candidatus Helarchaeota archaeon]
MFSDNEAVINRILQCFKTGDGTGFIELFNSISEQKLSPDFQQIKNLREKIAGLLVVSLQNSIQTSDFSSFFKILSIANKYQLVKQETDKKDDFNSKISIASDSVVENLHNLFGTFTSDFINFVNYDLPKFVLKFLLSFTPEFLLEISRKDRITEIRSYVENNFYLYGFRVRKVGNFDRYLKNYQNDRKSYKERGYHSLRIKGGASLISSRFFFEFYDSIREIHIIREDVFNKIIEQYKSEKGVFGYPCVSMVVSGGIGPQGKGFAYLTPHNEVIEICSDARQNKAYIIEFKKFLKSIFLSRLEEKLRNQNISANLISDIIEFLDSLIKVEFVSSMQINLVWDKIEAYLEEKLEKAHITEDFIVFLEKSIYNILVPVKIEDQFKTRMDLIKDNKLSPSDISKLVSLGNISHFDILCQRRFFLNNLDSMMLIFLEEEKL